MAGLIDLRVNLNGLQDLSEAENISSGEMPVS